MHRAEPTADRYRWTILAVFALLNVVTQLHWIALAPVTTEAATFYGVNALAIGFESMVFMVVYIVVSLPASYIIDTYGIRTGIGIGAALIGAFGLVKTVYAPSYAMVTVAQIGLAVAQPFILNAYTRLSVTWFPVREHATATGIAAMSQYVGIIIAMAVTPPLVAVMGIDGMTRVYGIAAVAAAVIFFPLFRAQPATPPSVAAGTGRYSVRDGLRHIFRNPQMLLLLYLFFIGLGIFNAITTWIAEILGPRGFTAEDAGIAGAAMMVGGIAGASILPPLSDRAGRRVPFLLAAIGLAVPGLVGLTFATTSPLLFASSFLLGFGTMSAGPIGFQLGAEISYPAPESTSQGVLMLTGQISGAAFIVGMHTFRSEAGSMTPFMVLFIVLTFINCILCTRFHEPNLDSIAR